MNRTRLWLTVCVTFLAANAFAQISQQYRNWGDSAIQYLMTKPEKTGWASLRSDDDAKQFIDVFWARRDPTPETPDNELRQQMEARIAEADKRYRLGKTPGSQTDKGLVYTLLGEPTQVETRVDRPPNAGTLSHFDRPINFELWTYRGEAAERVAGTKSFDIAFVFHDEKSAMEFELDGPSKVSFDSTALAIAKAVLKRPYLTAADIGPKADAARTVALGMIVVTDQTLANDVLRRAQEGEKFADLARKYSTHSTAQHGGYLGRIAFAELDDDIRTALAGKKPGESVLVTRKPMFAIMHLLTDAEASEAEKPAPK